MDGDDWTIVLLNLLFPERQTRNKGNVKPLLNRHAHLRLMALDLCAEPRILRCHIGTVSNGYSFDHDTSCHRPPIIESDTSLREASSSTASDGFPACSVRIPKSGKVCSSQD